ncbi:MAG: hypothetical protein AB200_01215 [Parcubacteria bacterium C7867-005]|nr:MAG: hypothetical protein AB200_01215 [Parcubacteria bacterium C7867-005]
MKKIIAILVLILIAFGVWFFYNAAQSIPSENPDNQTNTTKPDASNASFEFEDGLIKLTKGKNEQEVAPGSAMVQETVLTDLKSYGDLNGDNKQDSAAVLVQSGGGSGVFFYIGAYVSGPVSYKGSNVVFFGDRIEPKSISVKNGVITLEYLDRKLTDSYDVEPTIKTTKKFSLSKGILVEAK